MIQVLLYDSSRIEELIAIKTELHKKEFIEKEFRALN